MTRHPAGTLVHLNSIDGPKIGKVAKMRRYPRIYRNCTYIIGLETYSAYINTKGLRTRRVATCAPQPAQDCRIPRRLQ